MILDWAHSLYRTLIESRCRNGFHSFGKPERIFVREEREVLTGGDWPQSHVVTDFVPSGRLRVQCRHCGHHFFQYDLTYPEN
jgi:hypothetical protein